MNALNSLPFQSIVQMRNILYLLTLIKSMLGNNKTLRTYSRVCPMSMRTMCLLFVQNYDSNLHFKVNVWKVKLTCCTSAQPGKLIISSPKQNGPPFWKNILISERNYNLYNFLNVYILSWKRYMYVLYACYIRNIWINR